MQLQISLVSILLFPGVILLGLCSGDIFFPADDTKYAGSPCETNSGLRGICRKVSECTDSVEKLASKDLCSFDKSEPIYCCPLDFIVNADVRFDGAENKSTNSDVNAVENAQTHRIPVVSRPVEQICNRFYPDQVRGVHENKTQETDSSFDLAEPPLFMASIGWTDKTGQIDWKCTGVVIAEKIILTEASCIKSTGLSPSLARIEIISATPNKTTTRSQKILNITSIYTHPDFKSSEIIHNLGIIKVDTDASFAKLIKPACLSTASDLSAGQLVRWGFTNHTMGSIFAKNISLLNNEVCSLKVGKDFNMVKGDDAGGVFCGDLKEICPKDAGGPVLFHPTGNVTTRPFIVGMTTFGPYCDTLNPIVYTRLSSYLDWIEPFLNRET